MAYTRIGQQKITNRFNELTDDEQRFFNRYINAVASRGLEDKERERDYAIMKNIIQRGN
tara:strand:- start:415 stop:591 length:177 start_codon:yes stop_codon:yes gene_type:complete